jgi:hypothetical protein
MEYDYFLHIHVELIIWELLQDHVDFTRIDHVGVDLVRIDLVAPNHLQ